MQLDHLLLLKIIVFHISQQFHPFLDVLRIDEPVFLEDLLHLRNFHYFLLQTRELRL